jgi:hypothetical protein
VKRPFVGDPVNQLKDRAGLEMEQGVHLLGQSPHRACGARRGASRATARGDMVIGFVVFT